MANKYTQSTYTRISKDEDYANKALDSLLRIQHGQNVQYEIVGDKVIVNGTSIIGKDALMRQAIDMQGHLEERPELEAAYMNQQKRQDQVESHSRKHMIEKSQDQIMSEQAYSQMLSKASNRTLASQKPTSSRSNLPSERS